MDIDLADVVWVLLTMLAAGMLERTAHHIVDMIWGRNGEGSLVDAHESLEALARHLAAFDERLTELEELLEGAEKVPVAEPAPKKKKS